jgi:hypothetical protein
MSNFVSDETQALTPAEVRTVDFYGDQVTGAVVGSGEIYVPIRPICEYLGLDWSGQYQRIRRDEVLSEALRTIRIERGESVGVTPTKSRRGDPNILCLPLKLLPGFLFGISTERVKDQTLREKLIRYRRECYDALWEVFKPEILGAAELSPTSEPSGAAIAYELATAVQHLARQQLDFEQRLDKSARWARGIEDRVSALEMEVSPQEHISDAQAAELAGAVKNVAAALGGHSSYGTVYAELYRRFGISTYKNLPHRRYDEALAWLRKWFEEVSSSGT